MSLGEPTRCKQCHLDKLWLSDEGLCEECAWEIRANDIAITSANETQDDAAEQQPQGGADDGLPFRTLAELMASIEDARPDRWIVKHYIAPGAKTLFSSKPKVGKSTTAFGMVKAIRSGQPFAGLDTAQNVGVLYLTEETSVRALEVKAAAIDLDITDSGVLFVRRVEVFGKPWPEVVELLRKRAAEFKVAGGFDDVLVVIDTLGKWAGFEEGQEQDAGATRKAIELLDPLAGDGHAVLILTHAGWNAKRSRGSSAIPGEVDVVLYLDGEPGSSQPRSILFEGGRLDDGEMPRSWSLALGDDGLTSFGEAGSKTAVKLSHVLDAVRSHGGPISSARLAKEIGVADRTARSYLNRLVASGELRRRTRSGARAEAGRPSMACRRGLLLREIQTERKSPNGTIRQRTERTACKTPSVRSRPLTWGFLPTPGQPKRSANQ